jgi:hypothetical protein
MKLRVTLERSDGQIVIELVSHWSGVGPEPEDYNLHEMYPELIANVLQNLRSMCDEIEAGDAQPKLKNTETGDMRELRTSSGFGMAWKNLVE